MAGSKSAGRCSLKFFVTKFFCYLSKSKIHDFNLEKHTPQNRRFREGGWLKKMKKTNFSWKKYFWLKKISFPKKNNFPEIYFLFVKYRVFVRKKTLRQNKPLSRQHELIPLKQNYKIFVSSRWSFERGDLNFVFSLLSFWEGAPFVRRTRPSSRSFRRGLNAGP